jgi:hypothetical protein
MYGCATIVKYKDRAPAVDKIGKNEGVAGPSFLVVCLRANPVLFRSLFGLLGRGCDRRDIALLDQFIQCGEILRLNLLPGC